ncbi:MAG TPA: tetratricopeptide repeat protein [Thermoanaerobaculia bacterium]|nr:tetratricopeptide repeat protein [Thermoanaerobaculia bacterium]
MDKKHRHDLQRNDLREALLSARDYLTSHQSQSVRSGAAVVAVVVLVGAIWGGIAWRDRRLAGRLSEAIGLLDAPLAADGVAPGPGQRVFRDAAERAAAAKDELRKLAKDAPSSRSGRAATLLLMGIEGPSGVSGGAIDAAKAFAKGEKGTISAGIAFVSMLDAEAAAGRAQGAVETAKKALDAGDAPVPKDVLLLELGRLSEKTGKAAEAKSYYQRVLTDYPDSPVRAEAQQRSQGL